MSNTVTICHKEFDNDGNVIKGHMLDDGEDVWLGMAEIRFMGKDEKHLIIYMNKWLSMPENKKWLAQYK